MLLEKFDHLAKPIPSPFIITPKLAPLSSRSHSTTGAEMPDLSQFRRARKNSANIRQEKSILVPEETVTIRPPKIYAGSLPEVFRTDLSFSRQPSRQVSKGNEDIRNSSIGPEASKLVLKKEISMDAGREGKCLMSPMKVQVRSHRPMRKILTVANSREPTPLPTPDFDERILKPLQNLEIDKKNIFQTNIKPNPPPLNIHPSQNSKKLANIIRLNLKPFAENIEPNTRRSDKSFVIKKIFGKLSDQQQNLDLSIDEMRYHLPRNRAMTSSAMQVTLNELITLKKIKPASNNGILKRVLHAPSFQIFDVQEEPISVNGANETSYLKDWLESWKINLSHDKYLARVYSCFWNAPEGCISVLLEPSKKGFLSDLIHNFGSLPEICLREVARTVGKGLSHIQYSLQKSHGNVSPNEVIITARDTFKLGPGIYSRDANFQVSTRLRSQKSKESLPILSESRSQASLSLESLTKPYSQDIFDLGFMLLQCALGDLTLYDSSNLFSLKNIKSALDHPALKRALKKDVCCFLHNEDLMRDILRLLPEMSAPSVRGKILQNNFHAKDDSKESFSSGVPSHVSLLELLTLGDRFSKSFLDFLCCCLKLDSTKRPNIHNLLSHEFLNTTESQGPLVNLSELLKMEIRDMNILEGECAEGMAERHLDKFIEALRLAFLDQNMKIKFDSIVHLHRKTETTEKKIADLAHELGLSPTKLSEKLSDKLNESWSP